MHAQGFTFLGKLKMPDLNKIINPPTDKFQVYFICSLIDYVVDEVVDDVLCLLTAAVGKETVCNYWHI